MNELQLLISAALLVAAYGFLKARVGALLQPLRLEMAEAGETLIADETIPLDVRNTVQMILDLAFSARAAWLFVFVYPYFRLRALKRAADPFDGIAPEKRRMLSFVLRIGTVSIFANSPAASVIFMLEVLILRPVAAVMRDTIRVSSATMHPHWDWKNQNSAC